MTRGLDGMTELVIFEGNLEALADSSGKGEFDILFVDCRRDEAEQLAALQRMASFHPRINTILVVEMESPDLLRQALRIGAREVIKTPLKQEDIRSAFSHITAKVRSTSHAPGRVLSFMSCKGGSGATFLATNLAYALAARGGQQVLLIDLNLQFGDAILYVSDRRPTATLVDIARQVQSIDMALLSSITVQVLPNYAVLAAPDDPAQSLDIRPNQVEALIRFARANFDYVVLDLGRSFDTCSIQALDLSDHIYPVLQLTLPFLRDAKRMFDVFRSLEYGTQKVRPIVNREERSGDVTSEDANKHLHYKIHARIPNHYRAVAASVNQGVPILKLNRSSPVTKSLEQLAAGIAPPAQARPRGLRELLFGR